MNTGKSGNGKRFLTGWRKLLLYVRIAGHVAARYALHPGLFRWSPAAYSLFLKRALVLLLVFRHSKAVRVSPGFKIHLYLPAYPTPAFFNALEAKLLRTPPGPLTVVFSMTKACGYRCQHCYQRLDAGADLDEATMRKAARAMQDAGVSMFDIEGGEPLLRRERLLNLLRSIDRRSEVWINTVGAALTPEAARELEEAGLFGVMISVHSPDAAAHDAFTGIPGSFAAALRALAVCRRAGLATAVNSVLSEEHLRAGDLARLMELAREADCDFVQLIHPKPAGKWLGRAGMQADPVLIARIRREHVRYNGAGAAGYPALAAQVFEESEDVFGCTSGATDRFYLNANGEVQPCEFLNLSFGNVRTEDFAVILARMRAAFRTPCLDWLCCTQGPEIHRLIAAHGVKSTPLPWEITRELVARWDRGRPTPLYRRIGVYP